MNKKYQQELAVLLSKIKDSKLMDKFLEDILTPAEYEEVVTRWQIIKLLTQGMPQREIAAYLKVSIAKITRGSRELRDKNGGFWRVLKKNK
jgi:Trp operon repressor